MVRAASSRSHFRTADQFLPRNRAFPGSAPGRPIHAKKTLPLACVDLAISQYETGQVRRQYKTPCQSPQLVT